jgi:hypothetical protein
MPKPAEKGAQPARFDVECGGLPPLFAGEARLASHRKLVSLWSLHSSVFSVKCFAGVPT